MDAAARKNAGRDGRLSWSHVQEYQLQQELNEIARKECKPVIQNFGKCAERTGLGVVFQCRAENSAMNDCLNGYTNPDAFEAFRLKREREILAERQAGSATR